MLGDLSISYTVDPDVRECVEKIVNERIVKRATCGQAVT